MIKWIAILAASMVAGTGLVWWASQAGVGVPQPKSNPPSVREGSRHIRTGGHARTHYFVGGGIRGGK